MLEKREIGIPKALLTKSSTIWMFTAGIFAIWAAYSIHHGYEAGLAQAAAPSSAAGAIDVVVASTVMLIATLVLIARYNQTKSRFMFISLTMVTLVFWVGVLGLFEGFYSHTLKDILYYFFNISPSSLPLPAPLQVIGYTYDVPTNIFGEITGILPFAFAIWIAIAYGRLAAERFR